MNNYDLVIIGAGPAGLAASIYASRYQLDNLVVGKTLGGELSLAHKVCNYPGFEEISGLDLAEKWRDQAEDLGGKLILKEVGRLEQLDQEGSGFKAVVDQQEAYQGRSLIVATGSERRRLNIPGEDQFMGKGVSYCHVCDAGFFKDQVVAVVGGADAAVTGAIYTSNFAKKVYLIYRGEKLKAEPAWLAEWKKIETQGKGETIYKTNVVEILGAEAVGQLKTGQPDQLKDKDPGQLAAVKLDQSYQGSELLLVDGLFVEIGSVPGTGLVEALGAELDQTGHVQVNEQMATNIPGLFCAGDMTNKSADFKQAVWAIGQGARAAASAYQYLKKQPAPQIKGV